MARCQNSVKYRHHHTRLWACGVISVAILSLLGGCVGSPKGPQAPSKGSTPFALNPSIEVATEAMQLTAIPTNALVASSRQIQAKARRLAVPADPVAVDLYTLDSTCDAYQIDSIQVPRPQSMENTVDLILAEQIIPELALSGYRTTFDPETQTVTIDLRVARSSRRVLNSLSVCEQKALLGSLRETLLNQPDWKIKAVMFTNRGNPLVL